MSGRSAARRNGSNKTANIDASKNSASPSSARRTASGRKRRASDVEPSRQKSGSSGGSLRKPSGKGVGQKNKPSMRSERRNGQLSEKARRGRRGLPTSRGCLSRGMSKN